jgi:glycine/D-amino acid oxidase-like deaminating enzyme
VPEFDAVALDDATIVCRCEEVTAGALRAAGPGSLGALKKATRAGMGRCQGRMCGATLIRLAKAAHGGAIAEGDWAAPRAPLKPVPVMALAMEKPEWSEAPEALLPPPQAPVLRGREQRPGAGDLLVIGGGVLGLAIARAAAREGFRTILAERGEPGQGASTANAGSLHIQLHAYDSAGAAEGPESAAAQVLGLGPRSVALWRDIAREAGEPLAIRVEGGLMLAETEAQFRALADKVAMERDFGVNSHLLGANELRDRFPWLAPGFAGAAFCAEEGQMDPLRGLCALLALTRRAGVEIRHHAPVTAIAREGAGFVAETPQGPIRAARVVNAAGPWAGHVATMLGAPIPVRATVQQVIATEAAGRELLRPLVLHAGRHLSLKQGDAGHLILGGAWPGELDTEGRPRNRRASIEGNLWVARSVLPAIEGLHVIRAWTGINVLIPGPILGGDPRVPGLFHAVTFNGWTLAPVIAELLAEQLRGGKGPPAVFAPGAYALS